MEGLKIAGKYGPIKWHVQKVLRLVWPQCIDATTWDPYVHNQYVSTYYIHMYRHNKWRTKSWWPMIPTSIQIYSQLVFATASLHEDSGVLLEWQAKMPMIPTLWHVFKCLERDRRASSSASAHPAMVAQKSQTEMWKGSRQEQSSKSQSVSPQLIGRKYSRYLNRFGLSFYVFVFKTMTTRSENYTRISKPRNCNPWDDFRSDQSIKFSAITWIHNSHASSRRTFTKWAVRGVHSHLVTRCPGGPNSLHSGTGTKPVSIRSKGARNYWEFETCLKGPHPVALSKTLCLRANMIVA